MYQQIIPFLRIKNAIRTHPESRVDRTALSWEIRLSKFCAKNNYFKIWVVIHQISIKQFHVFLDFNLSTRIPLKISGQNTKYFRKLNCKSIKYVNVIELTLYPTSFLLPCCYMSLKERFCNPPSIS